MSANTKIQGYNLYAYCWSNLVNMADDDGTYPFFIITAVGFCILGAVVGGVVAANNGGNVLAGVTIGAAAGGLIVTGVGFLAGAALAGDVLASATCVGAETMEVHTLVTVSGASAGSKYIADNVTKVMNNPRLASEGYETYYKLKKVVGSAGEGKQWHHIVEQCQRIKSGFEAQQIQCERNLIVLDKNVHRMITAYYNTTTYEFTNGLSVRNWFVGKSFEFQYEFGIDVLRKMGAFK